MTEETNGASAPAALPAPAAQVVIYNLFDDDGTPTIGIEGRVEMSQKDTVAALFVSWLGVHCMEMFTIFMRQAKAHDEERSGQTTDVAKTSGPKLLGANGMALS